MSKGRPTPTRIARGQPQPAFNYAVALCCLFFVFASGVLNLKSDPIENDEIRTLNHIEPVWHSETRTIAETIQSVSILSPQHGPLYFVILNAWHMVAGSDLFTLRLLSTFFGVLTVAMTYRLGRTSKRGEVGVAAAIVLSFLALYMFYVHHLRMYALMSLASCCALWSYWMVRRINRPERLHWLCLFAAVALLPYIHYIGGLLLMAMACYHIALTRRDRRWRQILAVMALAGLVFLPWLPVVVRGLSEHLVDPSAVRASTLESIRALLSVLSNGLIPLPLVIAALVILRYKHLTDAQKYLAFITAATVALLFALNVFSPTFVAERMRYVLVLAVPYSCVVASATLLLTSRNFIRLLLLLGWCMSYLVYLRTEDYARFTNILQHETAKIPHYQDFIYESDKLSGYNELILSFHPNMVLSSNKTLPYYRRQIDGWAYIVHITYDANGDLVLQSGHSRYGTPDDIAANSNSIWVLHNPDQTRLDEMPVYADWFLQHFKFCKHFHESDFSVIDYYVTKSAPCDLITSDTPFTVQYDNGMVLANAVSLRSTNELRIYLRWAATIDRKYSLSLQIFDTSKAKVRQTDAVISRDPIDVFSFDLSELDPGDYTVELIVYNYETKESEPGVLVSGQQRFERSVTHTEFTIDNQA